MDGAYGVKMVRELWMQLPSALLGCPCHDVDSGRTARLNRIKVPRAASTAWSASTGQRGRTGRSRISASCREDRDSACARAGHAHYHPESLPSRHEAEMRERPV